MYGQTELESILSAALDPQGSERSHEPGLIFPGLGD